VQITAKPSSKINGSSRLPKGAEKHVQQMQKKYAKETLEKQTSLTTAAAQKDSELVKDLKKANSAKEEAKTAVSGRTTSRTAFASNSKAPAEGSAKTLAPS
jgi:hypothetical protein